MLLQRSEECASDHFTVTLADRKEEAPAGTGKGVPEHSRLPIAYTILIDQDS